MLMLKEFKDCTDPEAFREVARPALAGAVVCAALVTIETAAVFWNEGLRMDTSTDQLLATWIAGKTILGGLCGKFALNNYRRANELVPEQHVLNQS